MTALAFYLFILNIVLAILLGMASHTVLAFEERVIIPLLRTRKGTERSSAITYRRTTRKPLMTSQMLGGSIGTPAKFIQPRETT